MSNPRNKLAVPFDVVLDEDAADLLRQTIGDDEEAAPVRLLVGGGHSGYGLYLAHAEYQEEGAVLLCPMPSPASLKAGGEAGTTTEVPPVEDLLVMTVECGLIRMSKVMDADLQAALTAFAKRLASTTAPLLSPDDMKWLERIQDQFADGEGYDAPAETMKRLADLGAVRRTSGSHYALTSFGMHCLYPDEWTFPLRTHGEYMAEANARLAAKSG